MTQPKTLVFLLESVCCDTTQNFGVLAGVNVLWHSPKLWCSCWCQCVVTQPKPWCPCWCQCVVTQPKPCVLAGVSVLWHSPSLGVLAGVSVLWHSPSLGVLAGVSVSWHSPSQGRTYAVHCTVTKVTSGIRANAHPKYCQQKKESGFIMATMILQTSAKLPSLLEAPKVKLSLQSVCLQLKNTDLWLQTLAMQRRLYFWCFKKGRESGTVAAFATPVAHSLKEEVAVPILFLFDPPGQGGQPNRLVRKMGSQMPRSMTPHGMTWTQQKSITLKISTVVVHIQHVAYCPSCSVGSARLDLCCIYICDLDQT